MENFDGRVVVITGGASGIGFALARKFAAEGAALALIDVDAKLDAAVHDLRDAGSKVIGIRTDVRDRKAMLAAAATVVSTYGTAHLVALNAGVGGLQRTATLTPETWDWQLGVNVGGVVNGLVAFLPVLMESAEDSYLLLTSSLAAVTGPPYHAPYTLAKAGIVGLAESLFFEMQLENKNVGVSVLLPGPVASAIADDERNRPAGLPSRSEVDPEMDDAREQQRQSQLHGVSPDAVAELALRGIRKGQLYISTHPRWTEQAVSGRLEALLSGRNPQLPQVPEAE